MIDYETFVKIKVYKDQHGLKCSQIARELNLDYRTVEKWLDKKHYQQRKSARRASKLDPFKGQILRMLETYSAQIN
jgi:transposase